jgi:hypothetical protein
MPNPKNRDDHSAFPDREIIAKSEGRFAKADKQRAGMKADPKREVVREQRRGAKRAKNEKPAA